MPKKWSLTLTHLQYMLYPGQSHSGSRAYPRNTWSIAGIHPEWDGLPVHSKTQQDTMHTNIHALVYTWGNLDWPVCLVAYFWEMGRNQRTQRKWTYGQRVNMHKNPSSRSNLGRYLLCHHAACQRNTLPEKYLCSHSGPSLEPTHHAV